MQICYLILAHQHEAQLQRLIAALTQDGAHVFVHLDAATPDTFFEHFPPQANVVFIPNRVKVWWGGFSVTQATLNLLDHIRSKGLRFDYYSLLSGSDYPVQSPRSFVDFLTAQGNGEFISCYQMPNEAIGKPLSRLTTYFREPSYFPSSGLLTKLSAKVAYRINRLKVQRDFTKVFGDIVPYGSSMWWTFSHAAIETIHRFREERPEVVRFFRNTIVPDECFFQTILANSALAPNLRPSLTFTDWSQGGSHPAMITPDHIEQLKQCSPLKWYFARKLPPDSGELVDKIKAELW